MPFNKKMQRKPRKTSATSGKGRKRSTRPLPPMDYKDTELLSKFITEKGKILPRRITKLSSKDQRTLKHIIKRSRHSGLLSFEANF